MTARLTPLLGVLLLAACGPKAERELDCSGSGGPFRAGAPPALKLVDVDPERSEMAWGALVMNQSDGDESWVTVVDGCAEHIWWRPPSDPDLRIIRAHLSLDGERVLYAEHNREHAPDRAWLYEVGLDGEEVLRTTRIPEAHHDFAELPGDEVAWISWQYLENTWFPTLPADIVTDVVRTTALGTQQETDDRVFSLYDDTALEPWWTCIHMNPTDQIPGYAEWSHANSLMYEPESDRLFLYARYWDALVAFDRHSGELDWMIGGPHNAFEVAEDDTLPNHAHMSELWGDGMLVFDNNNHGDKVSRVVEYTWDERLRTVQETWSYEDGTFVGYLGDAQRLPGGNVLITWSTEGRMTEVTPGGDIVWEAVTQGTDKRLSRPEFHPSWPPRG